MCPITDACKLFARPRSIGIFSLSRNKKSSRETYETRFCRATAAHRRALMTSGRWCRNRLSVETSRQFFLSMGSVAFESSLLHSVYCSSPNFGDCACEQQQVADSTSANDVREGHENGTVMARLLIPKVRDWPQVLGLLDQRAHSSEQCCYFRRSSLLFLHLRRVLKVYSI